MHERLTGLLRGVNVVKGYFVRFYLYAERRDGAVSQFAGISALGGCAWIWHIGPE